MNGHIEPAGSLAIPEGVLQRSRALAADADRILAGRAALLRISPSGQVSAGGATRLLRAADGWCGLTLARDDDIAAVPALTESDADGETWAMVQRWASTRSTAEIIDRGALLGLPTAALGEAQPAVPRVIGCGTAGPARTTEGLLVVDLTSMWAGPLCARLLARAGATVVKVETPSRPDGTRSGSPRFFDWMNSGKLSYAVDLADTDRVRALLSAADVVLEGSRPAALARRGLGPHDCPPRAGRVWLRVTGHGTEGRNADRVAFGDDAAVAGGLVSYDDGLPAFIGDAIADPLTGLEAMQSVQDALARGGGLLVELSMAAVAATYAALPAGRLAVVDATAPEPGAPAAALGADNAAVERIVAERLCAPC